MISNITKYLKQSGLLFILLNIAIIFNNRFGYITLVGIFCIMTFIFITLKRKIDNGALVILLYLIFYILFSHVNGIHYSLSTLVLYAIAPFFFYQYGKQIPFKYKEEDKIIIAWLIIIISYGIDIYSTTISNIITTGELISTNRRFSFTDDDTLIKNATLVGLPMGIGMIGLPMFIIVKNRAIKLTFISVFILSVITTFSLLNRTGLIVAMLCLIISIGYKYRKKIILLLLIILSIVAIIFFFIKTNIISYELISSYTERNIDISTMGSRSYRWKDAIINLYRHPTGWYDGMTYYVHNMWLDVARLSGIIPFIILVYIAYDSIVKAFRLIKMYNNSLSYMMLGLNVCFFSTCFVEPIYGGTHFMLYCMLWGTENGLIRIKNIK